MLGAGAAIDAAAPIRIGVEFLADGRCTVSAVGDGFRANLTYLPSPSLAPTAGLRCTIPSAPRGRAVDLTVALPPGTSPAGDAFPRVAWRQTGERWIGTASLPSAPAFVRVPQAGIAAPARWLDGFAPPTASTPFGWNFYGWFAAAALVVAAYFAVVRATNK